MNETLLILALAAGFIIIAAAAYTLYSVIINMGPSLFFQKAMACHFASRRNSIGAVSAFEF